jgi:hypothetical protein
MRVLNNSSVFHVLNLRMGRAPDLSAQPNDGELIQSPKEKDRVPHDRRRNAIADP